MLWKYKKVYQETSENIVDPPVVACKRLLNITHVYSQTDYNQANPRQLLIEYILCEDENNSVVTLSIIGTPEESIIETISECIKEGSLFLNGVNIVNNQTTSVPNFTVTAFFEDCDNPCSTVTERASTIVDITYQLFPDGYVVSCNLASYCYLQYSEDGTTWVTYPTLYPPGLGVFFVSLPKNKVKFRFISRCQEIPSNEFEIEARTCVYLDSVSGIYTGLDGDSSETYIEYTLCNGSAAGVFMYAGMTSLSIGACIVEGSVYVGGIQIQVTATLTPFFSLSLNISEC